MKRRVAAGKISNSILWLCMMITVAIFAFFYLSGTMEETGSEMSVPKQTSLVLYWAYIIFGFVLVALLMFSIRWFYKKWKEDFREALKSLALFFILITLLVGTYLLGDGTPLKISGYDGKENTTVWLKVTDMWIYSIEVLLVLSIVGVFAGIIWSYTKKIN